MAASFQTRSLQKHVDEEFNISFDFTDYLPATVTISSQVTSAALKRTGESVISILDTFSILSGNLIVKGMVQAGDAGETYVIKCKATASSGEVFVLTTELLVSNEFTT